MIKNVSFNNYYLIVKIMMLKLKIPTLDQIQVLNKFDRVFSTELTKGHIVSCKLIQDLKPTIVFNSDISDFEKYKIRSKLLHYFK